MSAEQARYDTQFFSKEEKDLIDSFAERGYVIVPAHNRKALDDIQEAFVNFACDYLKISQPKDRTTFLDDIHHHIDVPKLNDFRLNLIQRFNSLEWARSHYHALAKREIEVLIGNELCMQKRVNLSIQLPNDESSLLPVHSDVWSGDSPFEMVVWVPLVDCYKTKSMFILPPSTDQEFADKMHEYSTKSAEDFFNAIKPHLTWLEVPYGHVLIFTHTLMHGNRVNIESQTRWSMNCRFKSLFSPFWDKRLGEFFEPITVRPATRFGMNYKLPGGFHE